MRDRGINVKLTENEHELIKERAKQLGFISVGEYVRYVAINTTGIKRSVK